MQSLGLGNLPGLVRRVDEGRGILEDGQHDFAGGLLDFVPADVADFVLHQLAHRLESVRQRLALGFFGF